MAITPLPARPIPGAETFEADAGALLDALPLFGDELDALQGELVERQNAVNTTAAQTQDAANAAAAAAAAALVSAQAAALSSGAVLWVSGTSYALNTRVISPANRYVYRRTTAAAVSSTDPSLDAANWRPDALDILTGLPAARPTLRLPYKAARILDPRSTFARTTAGWAVNSFGMLASTPAGVPRFAFSPVTLACLGLLIEPARTNLVLSSQDFRTTAEGNSVSGWSAVTAGATTAAPNGGLSPDGATQWSTITEDVGNTSSRLRFRSLGTISAGTTLTWSVHVAPPLTGAGRNLQLVLGSTGYGAAVQGVTVNPLTGAVVAYHGSASAASVLVEPLPVGFRVVVTATTTATGNVNTHIQPLNNTTAGYTSDGRQCYRLWQADCVQAESASAIIPTTTATLARTADSLSVPAAAWVRQGEGTLYAEFIRTYPVGAGETPRVLTLHDGTANNRITLQLSRVGAEMHIGATVTVAGVETAAGTTVAITPGVPVKAAMAYRLNDVALIVNGAVIWSSTSAAIPAGLTTLALGTDSAGGNQLGGVLADVNYWPARGDDAQWIALTN